MSFRLQIVSPDVVTLFELDAMRVIRNFGRDQMTEDTNEISAAQQEVWCSSVRNLPPQDFRLVLGYEELPLSATSLTSQVVAYGMLTRRPHGLAVSLAVAPGYQGQGYGTSIYWRLANETHEPVFATILKTNLASIRAAEKAKYVRSSESERVVVYCSRG